MSKSMESFADSKRRLKRDLKIQYGEENVTDGGFNDYVSSIIGSRTKAYTARLLKKYPMDLVERAIDWGKNNLSDAEWETPETVMVAYIASNPQEVSSKEAALFFDPKTGELRPFIKDVFDEPLRPPDGDEYQRTGQVREVDAPRKQRPKAPSMPSESKLKTMGSDEIAKIIQSSGGAIGEE